MRINEGILGKKQQESMTNGQGEYKTCTEIGKLQT
jgi:hypothetical protein